MAGERIEFRKEDADQAQKLGRALVNRVALCLKLATMHELSNAALAAPVRGLLELLAAAVGEMGPLYLQAVAENFFLNKEIVKLDFNSFESAQSLRAILKRLSVQEVGFLAAVDEAELRQFLAAFQARYRSKEPAKIREDRFAHIAVRALDKIQQDALGGEIDERQNAVRTYALVAVGVKEALAQLGAGKAPRLLRMRKAIQAMADASLGHESLLIGLARYPNLTGEAHFHLAAVTALVLLMARRLGVSRQVLTELCMAALLHDAGRSDLGDPPADGGARAAEFANAAERVPLASVLRLTARDLTNEILEYASCAYEHALPAALAGKPGGPSAAARIVAVPCAFDLMTAPRPGRRAVLPDQALRIILDKCGSRFDAAVARLFAATVGLYPVGTTVRLSGGQLAVVMEASSDPAAFAKPRVRVIRDATGPVDLVLDLASPGETASVVESVDPVEEDVNAAHFLLA